MFFIWCGIRKKTQSSCQCGWSRQCTFSVVVPNPPRTMCCPPPQLNQTTLWWQFNTSSTHFPGSNFKSKTIIPRSVEIHNVTQYKYVPILFVVLIADIDSWFLEFLHSAALHWCEISLSFELIRFSNKGKAQALSWSGLRTKEIIFSPICYPHHFRSHDGSKWHRGRYRRNWQRCQSKFPNKDSYMAAPATMAAADAGNVPLLFNRASNNAVLEGGLTSAGDLHARNSCPALPAPGRCGQQGRVEGADEDRALRRGHWHHQK